MWTPNVSRAVNLRQAGGKSDDDVGIDPLIPSVGGSNRFLSVSMRTSSLDRHYHNGIRPAFNLQPIQKNERIVERLRGWSDVVDHQAYSSRYEKEVSRCAGCVGEILDLQSRSSLR